MKKLPKIAEQSNSLTPTPSSGIYEPPLSTYVIAKEALVHPTPNLESEIVARLMKGTNVLLLAFQEDWVKVQSSASGKESGWALRIAFAMDSPKPAPMATDSKPTDTPSPTFTPTVLMTPALTATRTVVVTGVGTPILTRTITITLTPRPTSTLTVQPTATLIPPLELTLPTPILANAIVQASTLKLRSGPGENFDDLGTIAQNTVLNVTGQALECTWLNVITPDGVEGWVPTAAVTLNGDCAQIPVVSPIPQPPGIQPRQTPQPPTNTTPDPEPTHGTGQPSELPISTTTMQPAAKADLVATAFAIRKIAENTITFDYTIANQGAIPVTITAQSNPLGIAVHVFLSDSQGNQLAPGQTLYPPALKGLAPGQFQSYSYPGTFPGAKRFNPNGTLHLTLVVDDENVVDEVDEANNRIISPSLPITPTPTPLPSATLTPLPTSTQIPTALPPPTSLPTATLMPIIASTDTVTPTPLPTQMSTATPTLIPPLELTRTSTSAWTPTITDTLPDLIIESISMTSSGVQVVIKNIGNAPANSSFWVDLYINPNPVPTQVNQLWEGIAFEGLVWGVETKSLPLLPGDSLTLYIGDNLYRSDLSRIASDTIPVNSQVYVQVDSAHANTNYGGILEEHEANGRSYNNISSITLFESISTQSWSISPTATPTAIVVVTPIPTLTPGRPETSPSDEQAIATVRQDLSQRLSLNISEITLVSIEAVDWPDSRLGCGGLAAQVITPGLKIGLQAQNTTYFYHTSTKPFYYILC